MYDLKTTITSYLNYCAQQKRLDTKTLNAYTTDLKQFAGSEEPLNIAVLAVKQPE